MGHVHFFRDLFSLGAPGRFGRARALGPGPAWPEAMPWAWAWAWPIATPWAWLWAWAWPWAQHGRRPCHTHGPHVRRPFSGPGERSPRIETGNLHEIAVRTWWDHSQGHGCGHGHDFLDFCLDISLIDDLPPCDVMLILMLVRDVVWRDVR